MSDSADSEDKSSQNNLPILEEAKELPQTELREELVATAVKFLQNPKVRQSPLAQRKAFLERKGLTKAEIDLAVQRSGTADDEHVSPVARNANYQDVSREQIVAVPGNAVTVTKWTRVKETANLAVIFGAALYAVYQFYEVTRSMFLGHFELGIALEFDQLTIVPPTVEELDQLSDSASPLKFSDQPLTLKHKYLAPVWFGKKSKADELSKSVDELRRSFSEVAAGIAEVQQLMRTQQRALDEVVRVISSQRGPEELGRIGLVDIKDEVKSLKALLLHKNQFPALPTTTPVIPSWQLQRGQSEASVKSADAAGVITQSQDTKMESEKDQATVHQLEVDLANDDSLSLSASTSDGATSRTASKVAASKSVTDQCSVDGLFNGHLGQAAATDKLTAE